MFYQKITDIFAECNIDYDNNNEIAKKFYSTIQNKLHFTVTKNTAAEIAKKKAESEYGTYKVI